MHEPVVQQMADEAERFCARFYRNTPRPALLILAGECGTGKSHVARRIVRFAYAAATSAFETGNWGLDTMPSTLMVSWPEVTDGFKDGQYGVVDDCMAASLLAIDDLGAEHDPSKNAANSLCQILSRREQKFTVITTNVKPDAWEERFDRRIADRLFRNSTLVDLFNATSYAIV